MACLVTRNICFLFIASPLYFKAIPKVIGFYKGTFLHVIPVRIIVPCTDYVAAEDYDGIDLILL